MSVESFDPGAAGAVLDGVTLARLLEAAAAEPPEFGLSALERATMANLATAPASGWTAACEDLSDTEIESLIRFYTLAEDAISGWQAGDKSPVIALVKLLKSRGVYSRETTRWIKANSSNRFLPHGSLMDRL